MKEAINYFKQWYETWLCVIPHMMDWQAEEIFYYLNETFEQRW
jgi:hypothetical protein